MIFCRTRVSQNVFVFLLKRFDLTFKVVLLNSIANLLLLSIIVHVATWLAYKL